MRLLLVATVAGLLLLSLVAPPADAQVPLQADPGRVLQSQQRQMWLEQTVPWAFNPIIEDERQREEDNEPLIEFHNMEIQGVIMPSRSSSPSPSPTVQP